MYIVDIKKIPWRIPPPTEVKHFPCFVCGVEIATHKMEYVTDDDLPVNLCVCQNCLDKDLDYMDNTFFHRGVK